MDIVLKSRHLELTDRFREHVEEKLARLEKHDHRVIRVEVEVDKERNPRQQDRAIRVELTAFSKGPVVRAEAAAEDKVSALDQAVDKMASQMRRAADRTRRSRSGRRSPASSPAPTAPRTTPPTRRASAPSAPSPCSVTDRSWCARRPTRPRR